MACWIKDTNKPFGIFGATLERPGTDHQAILKKAGFIFTKETYSIKQLRKVAITGDHVQFAPDATFFINISNDQKANAFLTENVLENQQFIFVIPRLRYTPYHLVNPNKNEWSEQKIKQVEETNEKYKEVDHVKQRKAMIACVRETGNKVLVCREMTYQVGIIDELLIDPLPATVKPFVIKRGYWLPDEAASVYAKAKSVVSFKRHSPIIAAANKTPFFYLCQPEDTIKGQMSDAPGFNDWIFEIDKTTGRQLTDALRKQWINTRSSKLYLKKAMDNIENI